MHQDFYRCTTDDYYLTANSAFLICPCSESGQAYLADKADGSIVPGFDNCQGDSCQLTSTPSPPSCKAVNPLQTVPFNAGCGDDEHSCSAGPADSDGAPVRFSSGRVESNPITLFQLPAPDDIFFGYRMQWGSHITRVPARTRFPAETEPTIHSADESTYFVGKGWSDEFSDRLYVDIKNKDADVIVWQRRNGSVTFTAAENWTSFGGKYELVDRGVSPGDAFGRWLIRTTDPTQPTKIWTFESLTYTDYASTSLVYTLGRLKRHAVLAPSSTNLEGRYGFTLTWASSGTLTQVEDSFGRRFEFAYRTLVRRENNQVVAILSRSLETVSYRPGPGAVAVPIVVLQMTGDNQLLDRVGRPGGTSYTRFRYVSIPTGGTVVSQIIAPGEGTAATPAQQEPALEGEVVLEENVYGPAYPAGAGLYSGWDGFVGIESRYPGRHYAYEYTASETTQLDLHQDRGACASGCPSGTRCRDADGRCYVADIMQHETGTLAPSLRVSADEDFGETMGNSNAFERSYGAHGLPRDSMDAAGVRTSYGFDSLGRARCIVRNDNDTEAFADPNQPDTSDCAGPPDSAQIIRVDYNGPCSDGFASCVIKRTASELGSGVVEEEDFDANGLLVRTKVTGYTRDVDGNTVPQVQVHSQRHDVFGRIVETDGPLDDSVGVDKTTTSYHAFNSASPFDIGHVHQVTRFAGTAGATRALVTTYADYDLFGVPHRVIAPNGDYVRYEPSQDRLVWTITQVGADGEAVGVSTVRLNPDGTVRSSVDADGVCLTFEYTDHDHPEPANRGYVGAPTMIRRGAATDGHCGVVPIDRDNGEVEIRTYIHAERDRLESIKRQRDGVVELSYGGFTYDRDRRLVSADTIDSVEPFRFGFTDVLPSGVSAPGAPSSGSWRTETTVDALARPASLQRFIDATNVQTYDFGYATPMSPRPTRLTRGRNGAPTSVTTFVYDDFGRLVESVVPESGSPGSPAPTRFEYDVAGRMVRKRIGVGTALVQTTIATYDSLGRMLTEDHDAEHPVICPAVGGRIPVQDAEYRYDDCSGDVPDGFSCNHSLGRLTIARALVECGPQLGGAPLIKRGRWYDYDAAGRVARVAYATVSVDDVESRIGPPAITEYAYTAAGRMAHYTSPLNSVFGTGYFFDAASGRVSGSSNDHHPEDRSEHRLRSAIPCVRSANPPIHVKHTARWYELAKSDTDEHVSFRQLARVARLELYALERTLGSTDRPADTVVLVHARGPDRAAD